MRIDAAGVEHPTPGDIPGKDGYLHIADCKQCQSDFDGPVLWHAPRNQSPQRLINESRTKTTD